MKCITLIQEWTRIMVYQISNIFGLLDSSEVRAYLPLRPSFIDSLIRPLVTIGFLMVQCKVNEWNIKAFLRKEISLVGCSGLVALTQKYHRICILSRILTLVSTQQDFRNIQDEICLFFQHNTSQREKVCYFFPEWYQIPCPNSVMSNFIWHAMRMIWHTGKYQHMKMKKCHGSTMDK